MRPENREDRYFNGLMKACQSAIEENKNTIDATFLYKACSDVDELPDVLRNMSTRLGHIYPQGRFAFDMDATKITMRMEGSFQPQISKMEGWIAEQCSKKNKKIFFSQLSKFYDQESKWVRKSMKFFAYLKMVLENIKKKVEALLSYKIRDKQIEFRFAS